jgi:uncharacterized membrane protein YdbT with pleckstrin-like domain
MRCRECGVEVVPTAVFCQQCGKRLDDEAGDAPAGTKNQKNQKNQSPNETGNPTAVFQNSAASRRDAQIPAEEELWRGGYSSKAMVGAWAICAAISAVLLLAGILWMPRSLDYWLILLAIILLPWLYYLAVLGYRRMSVHYLLTTQRLIHERGILRRVQNRIELLDVDDIAFEQGLLERLVGVGTIRIVSSDRSDPTISLPGIDGVQQVAGVLDNARLAERRRRGVHIEQI